MRTPLVVVGAGASAAFLLTHLDVPGTLVVEKDRCPGPGVAYRTSDPTLRMNVRACQLSAHPDDPEHFIRWAQGAASGTLADDYVPRRLYGEYLSDLLLDATVSRRQVTAVRPEADGVRVLGPEGELFRAEHVVLAIGVPPTAPARFVVAPEV